jgi:hypothetical protein
MIIYLREFGKDSISPNYDLNMLISHNPIYQEGVEMIWIWMKFKNAFWIKF